MKTTKTRHVLTLTSGIEIMAWDMNKWENERDNFHEELQSYQRATVDPIKALSTDAILQIIRTNLSPTFHDYIDELTYRFE